MAAWNPEGETRRKEGLPKSLNHVLVSQRKNMIGLCWECWQHVVNIRDTFDVLQQCFISLFSLSLVTTNFHWYATPESNLSRAFGDSLPSISWCYRNTAFVSKIWWPLCSLFVQHSCLLFFKFTLASGVLLVQGFSVSVTARFLQWGRNRQI